MELDARVSKFVILYLIVKWRACDNRPLWRGGHYFEFSFPLSLGPFWRRVHMKCVESNLKVENNGACTGCLCKLKKNNNNGACP